ncbi:hypothetical protein MAPG_05731 [Magnaporthiopsis poae ATCC 64411]|uniref:Cytochrome b-c1 complex subunit 6, mitochondrial n=1 Tax=Magnaporthiopsis poae (strain ATCC 64411 / 73-15) TaxID=644358 RepID=A0A0C4E063_MAGP6|nr:hypothetical protein MAPG_05731 [Magnaporthiopsis poae ATCC 64411]
MGIWDVLTDMADAVKPWSEAEAEAPAAEEKKPEETTSSKAELAKAEPAKKEEDEDEEEEEEDDEEEEPVDPKERLEEECKNSKECSPAKHHFDECVERVTNGSNSDSEEKEDCVEEFFHLAHCATQCAAPKLWSILK